MSRTEEKAGPWTSRYECHCGKVHKEISVSHMDIFVTDGDNPGKFHICTKCGCKGSYKESIGRYKYTVIYRFFGTKISETIWEPWTTCSNTK